MNKSQIWFWMVAATFLIWNVFGCYLYILDVTMTDAQYAAAYGEEMAAARSIYPVWAVAAYAVAVWGGLLAALLLLLRRRLSATVFTISLVSAIICFIPNFTSTPLREAGGSTFWLMPVIVIVIGLVEIWFARRKIADGILR